MKQKYEMSQGKGISFMKTSFFQHAILFLFIGIVNVVSAQSISFTFANAEITNDGSDDFYEADIMLSTATDFKLGLGQFYFDYNTAAFGSSISGANLTFTHPAAPAVGDADYILDQDAFDAISLYGTILANNTSSKLSIAWTQAQNSSFFTSITSVGSPHKLAHVKIKYIYVNQDPMIAFDASLSQDLTFTASTTPLAGDGVQITDDSYDSSGATLPAGANTWTGTTDTDWDTATNWSLGTVPTGTTDVLIPNVANDPIAGGAILVNDLTLSVDAALTVGGAVTNNGTITVNSGASLMAKNSTAFGLTYKRNLASTNWYLISSPVIGESVIDFTTNNSLALGSGSGVSQNVAIAPYDNTQVIANDRWSYYTVGQTDGVNGDDTTDNLQQGKGFTTKLSGTGDISFTGNMPRANVGITISVGAGNAFNLVGNPYPSYIAATNSADATNNILKVNDTDSDFLTESTIWFWDQSANTGTGGYIPVNHATSRFIAPGQAFFVSANGSNFFSITEAMQSHQATDVFNKSANTRPEIKLEITDGTLASTTDIYFIEGTTLGFDNGYDSTIFGGAENDFKVYTHLVADSQGQNLGIQSVPNQDYENIVFPVGVNATINTEITFSAESVNIPTGLNVILEDRTTGTYTILDSSNNQYSVILDQDTSGIGRFYIHVNTMSVLSVEDFMSENISLYTTSVRNLRVTGVESGEVSIKVFSIIGKQVMQGVFQGNMVNDVQLPPALKAGIYIVNLNTEKGNIQKKIILE
ncbi:MAG: T9SS type A sorting domain-containing protein [Flavobacteriaceae bacterium]|nr:T9SS type A sorting domain-containing protein [Flavobacteriaceae bacterium]